MESEVEVLPKAKKEFSYKRINGFTSYPHPYQIISYVVLATQLFSFFFVIEPIFSQTND